MIRNHLPLLAVLALAACGGGNPFNFSGEPPEPTVPGELGEEAPITGVTVPAVVAQHLKTASYTPGAPTMKIDLRTLDGSPLEANYQRAAEFDAAGFEAYTVQETRSQRKFLALFRRSGGAEAGVVADGGQFVNYFGGGTFSRMQGFSLPTPTNPLPGQVNNPLVPQPTLLATYTGGYIGLMNIGPDVTHPGNAFDPRQSYRVTGETMINADFNPENLSVNGGVRNRSIVETGEALEEIFFNVTQITPDGAFSGVVKFRANILGPEQTIGNYAGVFSGVAATDVAGAAVLRPYRGDNVTMEHGAFALPLCRAGDPSPCP